MSARTAWAEVLDLRRRWHDAAKDGESLERRPASDSDVWLADISDDVRGVAASLRQSRYGEPQRAQLLSLLGVVSAWLDAVDRSQPADKQVAP